MGIRRKAVNDVSKENTPVNMEKIIDFENNETSAPDETSTSASFVITIT